MECKYNSLKYYICVRYNFEVHLHATTFWRQILDFLLHYISLLT